MEASAPVPTVLRSSRPKPTPTKETQVAKSKKDKQKNPVPMGESLRKHSAAQEKLKKDKEPEKVVDVRWKKDRL